MSRWSLAIRRTFLAICLPLVSCAPQAAAAAPEGSEAPTAQASPDNDAEQESRLLSNVRQLTFEGRRSGEGYFSADGRKMVFQSEREPRNPFFQIYQMDLDSGDIERISPGYGKTTCAWIHPQGDKVLFASTHEDPAARRKQEDEYTQRKSGKVRRYAWDYDENFEIYLFDGAKKDYRNLTQSRGYDAEGSWSPDGKLIAFASNRRAYTDALSRDQQEAFARDPSTWVEIYVMDAEGKNGRQLTTAAGYDGGPFFSPDGKRICWRRFTEDGAQAEIMTMNVDGTDQRTLTQLGVLSWAPFYHPSGAYLIFATNRHGFGNFELYLVDGNGLATPQRVTYRDGFDGLPAFSPDGARLAWTSNRTATKESQIYLGDWNHVRALELLGLDPAHQVTAEAAGRNGDSATARQAAAQAAAQAESDFSAADIARHVDFLCRPELAGRLTGTDGERLATAYVAAYFDHLGLQPAGDQGTWFQDFQFASGVSLGDGNVLSWGEISYQLDREWRPLPFSQTGKMPLTPVVFAGYGIAAPATDEQPEYDSFAHLDVRDKWVMLLRFMPEDITPERRQHLARYSSLRFKAMLVRDKGARGLIVVSGPKTKVQDQLVGMQLSGSVSAMSLPVISVSDQVAQQWLEPSGKSLAELQSQLDTGELMSGVELKGVELTATIDIHKITQTGRNVLGRLPAGPQPLEQIVVVGAHVDHLGTGPNVSSLADENEKNAAHPGADDNASGVAALLEIAEYLSQLKSQGQLASKRDILLAAWSGEELGLVGSTHFINTYPGVLSANPPAEGDNKEGAERRAAGTDADSHVQSGQAHSLGHAVMACLNLDMVGRLDKKLILQGVGSSSIWPAEIERRNAPVGLAITLQNDSYIPTDASAFYLRGVPILSAFTGSHREYHTPRDTPEKLNYEGAARIARLMALVARSLAMRETQPDYVAQSGPKEGQPRANLRVYLGTIPDYGAADVPGLTLAGVASGGPADKAGLRAGDIIVQVAGRKIENIYDYTFAIEALKVGQAVSIVAVREGNRKEVQVIPASRD